MFNPENYRERYIEHLNECFNGWGGIKEYEYFFNRKAGSHLPDLILIENDEDGVIAGSAVSYRKLTGPLFETEIGIMTGSWTLPAARRKGCFSKMIEASRELCKNKNIPYLTAFVTESNASRRRLKSAGSFMYPSYHLFSPENPFWNVNNDVQVIEKSPNQNEKIFSRMIKTQEELLSFSYKFEEFTKQYLERIKGTTILQLGSDFAVLENGANEVKVLLLTYENVGSLKEHLKKVTNWCLRNKGKKAFLYSTRKEVFSACMELGFESGPGFFTILPAGENSPSIKDSIKNLNIQMADKV